MSTKALLLNSNSFRFMLHKCFVFVLFSLTSSIGFSQCVGASPTTDCDGDGVPNIIDLDDDNDGVFDTDEGCNSSVNYIESFNSSNSGWVVDNDNVLANDGTTVHSSASPAQTNGGCSFTSIPPSPSGNGYIIYTDETGGNMYFRNPSPLNLNMTSQLNGSISFDWINGVYDGTSVFNSPMTIFLSGGGSTAQYTIPDTTISGLLNNGWHSINIPLTTANFGGGLTTVLSNLEYIRIKVENINQRQLGLGSPAINCSDAEYMALDEVTINSPNTDTDDDGVPNCFDTDSDNDGCPDADEVYGIEGIDSNGDGTFGGVITPAGVDASGKVIIAGYR